jgi:hypothetical protein
LAAPDRIAILVIAHANPRTFERLVAALQHPRIEVFVHIDARADLARFQGAARKGVTFIADRVANNWGAFTQIEVALNLLRAAQAAGPFASYVTISGDSLPLVENQALVAALNATPTALRLNHQLPSDKSYRRVRDVYAPATTIGRIRGMESHLDRVLTEADMVDLQRAIRSAELKRNIPFAVYKGSQWFAISDQHLAAVLDHFAASPDFVEIFRWSLIPDELFFHSALKLVDPAYESPGGIMAVDWKRKPKPFTLRDPREIELVQASDGLFFRKFCDDGLALVDAVLAARQSLPQIREARRGAAWRFLRGPAVAAKLAIPEASEPNEADP